MGMPEHRERLPGATAHKFALILILLGFVFFAALYIILSPSLAYQPWDSLDYAHSTELIGIRAMRGNHPLVHLLLYFIFTFAKRLGYQGRALGIFQVSNGLAGGMIIAFFLILLIYGLKIRVSAALGFAIVLGASYNFWFFAGSGDIYTVAMLMALLAWMSLIYEITRESRPHLFLSGILVGLSILAHQLEVIMIPVGLALIFFARDPGWSTIRLKIKQAVIFVVTASAVTALGYLVLGRFATETWSLPYIIGWIRGYFGDPSYGRYLSSQYLSTAWVTASQAVLIFPPNRAALLWDVLIDFLILLMLLGLLMHRALDRRKRSVLMAAALQCLLTWPLIVWWEPQNPKFWLLTLTPWVIFLALSLEAIEAMVRKWLPLIELGFERIGGLAVLITGIGILSINLQFGMLNVHNPESENSTAFNAAMDSWLSHSRPNDVLITAGDLVPDLLFWGNRPNTVNLYRSLQAGVSSGNDFSDLRQKINQALCNHQAVFWTPAAVRYIPDNLLSVLNVPRGNLQAFFDDYTGREDFAFSYRDLMDGRQIPVYALSGAGDCVDQN
jgi:hypothetical protein